MKEVADYKILQAATPEDLEEKVFKLLEENPWQPHGSMSACSLNGGLCLLQPMILIEEVGSDTTDDDNAFSLG